LRVSEIAPCAVWRRNRGKIFVRDPVNGKGKRREEERSAPKEAADEKNTEPENNSSNQKERDHDLRRHLDLTSQIIPLVHSAEEPRNCTEQKSGPATKSWCNREHWDRRQPKHPPNRMKPGAEIEECSRRKTGGDDEKNVRSSHPKPS
jgi:hypothetical protein